ncbi:MAG: D-glycerate dehydrogenase [Desulfobacteraceae bacterium]
MMNVLVTGNLPDAQIERIEREQRVQAHRRDCPIERRAFLESIGDKQGLLSMITDQVDAQLLDRAPGLKIIANFGVGYNNIDVPAATRRGIMVTNTPGVLTDTTADLTMALILAVARRVVEGDRHTRQGRFRFWAPFYFLGHEVTGKTLGIVGMGRIGRAVARRAAGFNMQVLYHNRNPLAEEEEQVLQVQYADLKTLLQEADFISLHTPLTPQTRHLIGSRELAWMKSNAFLINTARGAVVDERALLGALEQGRIGGAGLDVYENEPMVTRGLERLDNVVLLPHVGSATVETRQRMAAMDVDNLLAGLEGRMPPNCINPNVA